MFVIVVGAGVVGRHLAAGLIRDGHEVELIEKNPAVAEQVARELGVKVVQGDADDPKVLEEANLRRADALIAVTGHDEDNLVACTLAKYEFAVGRVLCRVNNPSNAWMFGRDMGVDVAVNEAELMAALLEEEIGLDSLVTLLRLREGEVALVEKPVAAGGRVVGRQLQQVALPADALVVAVVRDGRVLFPRPDLALASGDHLFVLTTTGQEPKVAEALQ